MVLVAVVWCCSKVSCWQTDMESCGHVLYNICQKQSNVRRYLNRFHSVKTQ